MASKGYSVFNTKSVFQQIRHMHDKSLRLRTAGSRGLPIPPDSPPLGALLGLAIDGGLLRLGV